VVYGTLANPRFDPQSHGGSTELYVREALQGEAGHQPPARLLLPVYLPVIGNATPREYIVFARRRQEDWEILGGFPASANAVRYLRGALQLPPDAPAARAAYFFGYLDHSETAIATDAFTELARTTDADLVLAALHGAFAPDRLRRWLEDPNTPQERRGLIAYLLGLCGQVPKDVDLLRQQWRQWLTPVPLSSSTSSLPRDSTTGSGLLSGLVLLDPALGWKEALAVVQQPARPVSQRWAVLETLRFFQAFRPPPLPPAAGRQPSAGLRYEHRAAMMRCYAQLLKHGDLADQAIEDLRRWGWWDLTAEVLAQFDQPTHQAPIVRRAIVRYALSAPQVQAQQFVQQLRQREPELVRSIEELLRP
jgi:hypothetical protein